MLHQGRAGLGQPCVDTLFLLPLSSHSSGLQTVNTGAWSVTTHTIVSTQRETVIETNDICQHHLRRRVLERNTDDDIMMHLECQHVELGVSTCELRVSTRALSVNMWNHSVKFCMETTRSQSVNLWIENVNIWSHSTIM